MSVTAPEEACRADIWLWRARFFKTRALAAQMVQAGRIRLTRHGAQTRIDKAARPVRPGDELVFAIGGRLIALRVIALGERRGPAAEARGLYAPLEGVADVVRPMSAEAPIGDLDAS